jgi:hypothetical protein
MNYVVVYTDDADDLLAAAWLDAPDRSAVTLAQNQIDQLLSRDPKSFGQEIAEGLWRIEVPPLFAYFEISDNNHEVTVTGFRLIP